MARKDEIDVSNVRITFDPNGPPITEWLRKEIKRWMAQECGVDVDVELNLNLNVNGTSKLDAS